ncbi:MAG: hypothetical protein BSR46_13050 [Candidatus Dactylopiibacterium carminicum]|nr:MAG: hypothetical protein BSR46_13050 [Candidatus Dactylopiibacterium carminicum]
MNVARDGFVPGTLAILAGVNAFQGFMRKVFRDRLVSMSILRTLSRALLPVFLLMLPLAWQGEVLSARFCVDPDWAPFEVITPEGRHQGIAADLLQLVARRAEVKLELVPTAS